MYITSGKEHASAVMSTLANIDQSEMMNQYSTECDYIQSLVPYDG